MSAWGKTGRVTLGPEWEHGVDTARDVTLPGNVAIGRVLAPRGGRFTGWAGTTLYPWRHGEDLPSLDAAVMWVLRRAAPDVWREERGDVWRIGRADGGKWHVWGPSGTCPCITPGPTSWGDCLAEANREATS